MPLEDTLHRLLGRYMSAPQWVRSMGGAAYRNVPDVMKYGPRYAGYRRDAELGWSRVSPESVETRLALTLETALTSVPAYREFRELAHDSRDAFDRLAQLPLVSKLEIKSGLHRFVSTAVPARRRLRMFTGGSTAHPMLFYLERGATRPRETAYSRAIDRDLLGSRPGDWTLSLRGRTVSGARNPSRQMWLTEPIKRHLIFSSDHLEERYMPRYVEPLRQLRPRVVHAFPSALYPLCRWLLDHPCPEFTDNVAGVLLTSENVYGFQLELFRRVFKCPVILHYGQSERVLLATSTGPVDDYTFWPLYGFAELVTAQGAPVTQPGVVGEIVGTGFDNLAMPFVRYRTGDLAMWKDSGGRIAGRPQVMQRIDGRLQEFVVCKDERLVSITTLGAAHFSDLAAVDSIQFEQHRAGHLVLRFVAGRPLGPAEQHAIGRAIESKTQGGCQVSIVHVDRIERTARGKHRMLIQHLPLQKYLGASHASAGDEQPDSV